jgi:hypothetical protein
MATATISIGRGGGERRLSDRAWYDFTTSIRSLLNSIGATTFVDGAESIGEWEGVAEESRTWVADISDHPREYLVGWLQMSAGVFDQDAIALTIGESRLITPDLDEEVVW